MQISIFLILSIGLFSFGHTTAPKKMNMSEPTKEALLEEKSQPVFFQKAIEYFLANPNTKLDRECYENEFKDGQSIDFVIDLAPSPSHDKFDKMAVEECPVSLYLQHVFQSASRVYFGTVQLFIDAVTVDMKPERTYSVIYDKGRKYYIRGRNVEDVESLKKLKSREFTDQVRNLKTLWPEPTNEVDSVFSPIVKNNLGKLTKLSLWNRDNGLPTVLNSNRVSNPIYTIVISDGSSGAKITDLTDDLWRTTVIDVGNRRSVNSLSVQDMHLLAGVYSLMAPQQLASLIDTIRFKACLFAKHATISGVFTS